MSGIFNFKSGSENVKIVLLIFKIFLVSIGKHVCKFVCPSTRKPFVFKPLLRILWDMNYEIIVIIYREHNYSIPLI